MKASTQSRHQRGHAEGVIFGHDCPVAPAPGPGSQERGRSQGPARCAPRPAHGPVPGRGGGAGRCPEPDGDMGAHHRPDRRRPALSGAGGGVGPSIGVHHPTGAPGPGARRPRRPLGVMVVDAYRHHQRPQGDSGGRQDHAWSARRRGSGAAPPGRLGPRHGRCAYPGAGGRQDQRDPNPARAA